MGTTAWVPAQVPVQKLRQRVRPQPVVVVAVAWVGALVAWIGVGGRTVAEHVAAFPVGDVTVE